MSNNRPNILNYGNFIVVRGNGFLILGLGNYTKILKIKWDVKVGNGMGGEFKRRTHWLKEKEGICTVIGTVYDEDKGET